MYTGPNVMLGYAAGPADLSLGRTVDELRTGDIARRADDGLYEIVGRRSDFAKILGLRVDPRRVEELLAGHGVDTCCVGGDDELLVAVRDTIDRARVRRLVADGCGLPPRAVRVLPCSELPRLPTGKPDRQAVRELARRCADPPPPRTAPGTDLRHLYAEILDRDDVTDDSSFVDLGGDSLSYVEMSLRLEQALGHLPANWHTLPIRELRPLPERPVTRAASRSTARSPARRRTVETSVALRAIAILLIVGTHSTLFNLSGGAHLLLGVAGFNFARFQLTTAGRGERLRRIWASIIRIVVPSVIWIAAAQVATGQYGPANLVLLHSVFGPSEGGWGWHFWFIEAIVYLLVAAAVLLSVPAFDRLERRFPYALPLAVAALGLVTRYDLLGWQERFHVPSAVRIFWLFALGWAAAKATTGWQRPP